MSIRCEFSGQEPVQITLEPEIWLDAFGFKCGSFGKGQCRCGREVGLTLQQKLSVHLKPKED